MTESDPHGQDDAGTENEADGVGPRASSRRAFLGGLAVGAAAAGVPAFVIGRSGRGDGATEVAADSATAGPTPSTATPVAENVGSTPAEVRRAEALEVRRRAAALAAEIDLPEHRSNGDERADNGYALAFTKGLPHNYETGLLARPADFEQFRAAIESGRPEDFIETPLGPDDQFRTVAADAPLRAWESQSIGLVYDLIGPDMQAVTMPPAPSVGSPEFIGELSEVYAQALIRDEPLANFRWDSSANAVQARVVDALNNIDWFRSGSSLVASDAAARNRRRTDLNLQTAFRGIAPGDTVGPYLSQLLLAGAAMPSQDRTTADGLLQYGAQTISQRVRTATTVNFMNHWDEWFDVQNALQPEPETYTGEQRFITTGRDLASYVHYDALYQSYLNASLVLFALEVPLDPGMPFGGNDATDHQQGFVLFGEPHVLAMLAEVCMRALKTVKYQKFNVHRRARPEEIGGRLERALLLELPEIAAVSDVIESSTIGQDIRMMNTVATGTDSILLPMAFPEGSPMHPSYGAGHGTVAGACTTILKALFDHEHPLEVAGSAGNAFVANRDGSGLERVRVFDAQGQPAQLTVEGEVNKLAANISIGRDWAGVHYFSDYWESMLLGEAIAVQILREHMLTADIDYELTIPTFEGGTVRLTT